MGFVMQKISQYNVAVSSSKYSRSRKVTTQALFWARKNPVEYNLSFVIHQLLVSEMRSENIHLIGVHCAVIVKSWKVKLMTNHGISSMIGLGNPFNLLITGA